MLAWCAMDSRSCPARILLVRLSAIGDVIHTLPAAATLKTRFPAAAVEWVVDRRWAYLLEENPFLSHVIPVDGRSLGGVMAARRLVRSRRYDLVVDFQGLMRSAWIAGGGIGEVVGLPIGQVREWPAAFLYSRRVAVREHHMVDRNLELAASVGATRVVVEFPLPRGRCEGELPDRSFVLASPVAGWGAKEWPLQYYGDLAAALERKHGVSLVLNGPSEVEPILRSVPQGWLHLSGLPGLVDATRRAVAVVGVDSGPLHIAAALGKPGVAVFGPTDPSRNGPYGGTIRVLRSAHAVSSYRRRQGIGKAMWTVTPADVLETIEGLGVLPGSPKMPVGP